MTKAADTLFLSHTDPMWIFDLETLLFVAVNAAAIKKYGYSHAEFLTMTIGDLRPEEGHPTLQTYIRALTYGLPQTTVWRHRLKSGEVIDVDITGNTIEHKGRSARLIAARDVSRIVRAEQLAREALEREEAAQRSSDALARQFQIMFDSIPGMFLVFSLESLGTIAASDSYLAAVGTTRAHIVGRNILDVLPVQPDDENGTRMQGSFRRVLELRKPDVLGVQRFVVPNSGADAERYWAVTNTPVNGPDGRLLHVILRIQDVTDAIASGADESRIEPSRLEGARQELFAQTQALQSENIRLSELATRLRTMQRLLGTGMWDYDIAERRLVWSSEVYEMYGVTENQFGHRFEDYVALVHPDDRAAMRADFETFIASGNRHFAFAHKVRHSGGRIVHVHGVAERVDTAKGAALSGVVQDVTERVEAAEALAHAKRVLEIAGTSAKFGAYSYDVATGDLRWSDEIAQIHEEPKGFSPTVAQAFAYYAPEHRERITAAFRACVANGQPVSDTLQIITATGRRPWVRVTGEAERDEAGRIVAVQGSFQDISELVSVRKRAEDSEHLLAIAGRAVKLGGWRVSLQDQKVFWTDGVAEMHELPPGTSPTYEGGLDYFAPEDRDEARRVFDACANDGIPFDNVRDMITAKGNRIKVRSFGIPVRDGSGRIVAIQGAIQDISEIVEVRRQLEQSSQMIVRTFESIRDGFFTLDHDWRFVLVNSECTRLFGKEKSKLIGHVIWDVFPLLAPSEFARLYKKALETNETQRFVSWSADMDRWFDVAAFPSAEGLSVYFEDVTARRKAQENLRLLDASVERLSEMVVIMEAGGSDARDFPKIVSVNAAFERITGYTRQEAIGQTPRMLQGPKTHRGELHRIRTALETLTPVQAELINYTKSGEEYWVELEIVPVANEAGQLTHLVSIERDITSRKRSEEALQISEARFRLIARATGNVVWEWDVAGGREWWSEGLTEVFGHHPVPGNALPEIWRANVHDNDKLRVDAAWERMLTGEAESMHERYSFRRANGTWAFVEDRGFAIHDNEGRVLRVLGSMTDISEQMQLEDRLRQSQKLEAIGQLTGGVAHDFNNLLTIIIGNTELLQSKLAEGTPLRHYVDMSALAADRAAQLTQRLLAFSRQQALQPRTLDVNGVISGLEGMIRRTVTENIVIRIVRSQALWKTEADLAQLETAILNLVINSRDAMPSGGTLTIETSNATLDHRYVSTEAGLQPGQYVLVAVSDTGMGISQDKIERVFEPFFTTKAAGKGTGLGLSMVYGFVKQTGGHVGIYSEPNQGTTVRMYFPTSFQEPQAPGTQSEPSRAATGKETVLVVEDDSMILLQVREQLGGLGYTVMFASDGPSALGILRERSDIDLLFTDIVLPGGMNGREIADAARDLHPGLKILYTSGYSETVLMHQGRLDQGVELLSKPYRRSDLASKIRTILEA
jgi:PAS domain S-box-containing protein